ncbi:hypothetical protein GCM10017559_26810 [Streptosporangium longisporum]|uniref:Uncharacterized protein n=1 Tax=Streptosporangium longisporum TaxID=46187 RepID=A0ABN3XWQ8_9ACTN
MEGREGLGEGLLKKVLGVRGVSGHPKRGRVELVEIGHDIPLEPCAPLLQSLLVCRRDRTHPLKIAGVLLTRDTVLSGEYPFSTDRPITGAGDWFDEGEHLLANLRKDRALSACNTLVRSSVPAR